MAGTLNIVASSDTTVDLIFNEVPTGTLDGVNTTFYLTGTPVPNKFIVSRNGLIEDTSHYSVIGNAITFTDAPIPGEELVVTYSKFIGAITGVLQKVVAEYQIATSGGGPSPANVWTPYPLNVLTINDGTLATLVGNEIQLPAGTYELRASAKFMHFWRRLIRVIRVDTTAVIAQGLSTYDGTEEDSSRQIEVAPSRFTLAGVTNIRMEYIMDTPYSSFPPDSNDLGVDDVGGIGGSGLTTNIFGYLELVKIG